MKSDMYLVGGEIEERSLFSFCNVDVNALKVIFNFVEW